MSNQAEINNITVRAQQMLINDSKFNNEEIKEVLLRLSMNEINFELIQNLCQKYITSSNSLLKHLAIISIGHMIRVYCTQVNADILKALALIYSNNSDAMWGAVDDVYDDMGVYLGISKGELIKLNKSALNGC